MQITKCKIKNLIHYIFFFVKDFMMNQKEIISFLSREQEFKKCFLQLANQKGLPKDIILFIYRILQQDKEYDMNQTRNYHLVNIYRNTLIGQTHLIYDEMDINTKEFREKLPINRGPEWSIKWSPYPTRINLLKQIQIIGEPDYLYENTMNNDDTFHSASLKSKLRYINLSPFEEVMEDYLVFINNDRPTGYRVFIDNYGEGFPSAPRFWFI